MNWEVQETKTQANHVHLIVQIPSELANSEYMARLKGQSVIPVLSVLQDLTQTTRLRRGPLFGRGSFACFLFEMIQNLFRDL
jgi:REP element-mobilizing transposase RayT